MLAPELIRFVSYILDVTALKISYGAIFHLDLSPMPEFSFHLEVSLVSSTFFQSPYYKVRPKIFLRISLPYCRMVPGMNVGGKVH